MIVLVIYDIPSDRLRERMAELCMDYGLVRVQFSAFLGEMNTNRQQELLQRMKREIARKAANVQLFPICEKDIRLRKKLVVSGEQLALPEEKAA